MIQLGSTEFIVTWQQSRSVKEVAEKMRVPVRYIHTLAYRHRRLGVKLNQLSMGRPPKDRSGL